jgi:hypothetical protein
MVHLLASLPCIITVIIHANEVYGFFFSICVKFETQDPNMNQSIHGKDEIPLKLNELRMDDLKHET